MNRSTTEQGDNETSNSQSESVLKSPSSHDILDNSDSCAIIRQKMAQLDVRRVSFPQDEDQLVTGYLEPANPWALVESVSSAELANIYRRACHRNKVEPIPLVLNHIKDVDLTLLRSPLLRLSGVWLPAPACESLEELLRRVQYVRIELAGCGLTDDTAVSIFDMIEYYESTNELDISENVMLGVRGWEACAKMIRNTQSLTTLEARFTQMQEGHVIRLSRGLRDNCYLCILKLENCGLSGQGITVLVGALKSNYSLKELWIANNELVSTDALPLSSLLKSNLYLQLLDVSNNQIEDTGVGYISEALIVQAHRIAQKEQELRQAQLLMNLKLHDEKEFIAPLLSKDKAQSAGPSIIGQKMTSPMLAPPASRVTIKNHRSPPVSPSSSISSTQSLEENSCKQFQEPLNSENVDSFCMNESDTPPNSAGSDSGRFDQYEDTSLSNSTDLSEQLGKGLSVLILWNNKLTKACSTHIARILDINDNLEILNIGQNALNDEVVSLIKVALMKSTSLLCLGLQSTQLTCNGVIGLADTLMTNTTLKRLDLRDNFIKPAGLKSLIETLETNFSISRIDLDDKPKKLIGPDLTEYQNLVHRIQSGCARNESFNPLAGAANKTVSSPTPTTANGRQKKPNRKISLTCQSFKQQHPQMTTNRLLEPRHKVGGRLRSPLPSPIPSPSSSPIPSPSRHRFLVSKVTESPQSSSSSLGSSPVTPSSNSPTCFFQSPSSRFRVTVVEATNGGKEPKAVKANTNTTTVGFDCKSPDSSPNGKSPDFPSTKDMNDIVHKSIVESNNKVCDNNLVVKVTSPDDSLTSTVSNSIVGHMDVNNSNIESSDSPQNITYEAPIRNVEISVTVKKSMDRVTTIEKAFNETCLDSPDLEITRYMDCRQRSIFGSTSSLEASTSSMESISVECSKRPHMLNQTIDLNMSLSSNDSFEMEINKFGIITNDSLDLVKGHGLKSSVTSFDSSVESTTNEPLTFSTMSNDLSLSKDTICESVASFDNISISSQDSFTTKSNEKVVENTTVKPVDSVSSNQNTLTSNGNLSWTKAEDIKKRIRKTSWVPPKLESWIFDDPKPKTEAKLHISKSDSVLPGSPRNSPPRLDEKSKSEESKIPRSLDKLLSIFQHPTGLFSRNSTPSAECPKVSTEKKDNQLGNMLFWASNQHDEDKTGKSLILSSNDESIVGATTDDLKVDNTIDLVNNLDHKLNDVPSVPLKNSANINDSTNSINKSNSTEIDPDNLVENISSQVKEGIKENISPEHTVGSNVNAKTISQLMDNINIQSNTIDRVKSIVESIVNPTDEVSDLLFEEKLQNELERNELNANRSIDKVQIISGDTEIVECVNASEIIDNEMKNSNVENNSYGKLGELARDSVYSNNTDSRTNHSIDCHRNSNDSLKSYESVSEDLVFEEVSIMEGKLENIVEM